MVFKLYGSTGRANKIVVAAKYNNVTIEPVPMEMGVTNKTPEFLKKNPVGKVPVLETEEGTIFESNAILRFIARTGGKLYGKNNFEAGQIDQWIDFAAGEFELPTSAWVYPIFGLVPNNALATKKAQEDIKKVFHILDSHLITRTFFVGNSISIADLALYHICNLLYKLVLDAPFRKDFVNVNRWFFTIGNQPIVKGVYGDIVLCEKPAVPQVKKEEKKEDKKEAKQEKPKQEKPKQEAKPKEEKKPAPKKDDDEEEPEDYEKEEKKKPNPLDALPKSSFVLDEWKRMYSNNDTRTVALPWFFQNVDLNGYSLWKCDYKYNNELTKVFMTNNLISGWFQRLEKAHKYAFGSILIFGEEGKSEISGIWLFRGDKVPEVVTESDDYEHYNWEQIDLKNDKQKKLLEDYFAWDGELGGKKFATGKVFK